MEILTGTLFYVQLGNDATVADLKREIGAQQKLPCDCDRLIFVLLQNDESRVMSQDQDEVSLADCGVTDGSHIYLFFKPLDHDGSSSTTTTTTQTQSLVFPLHDPLLG